MTVGNTESGPLEGDYIETVDGLLFAVKGVQHPPGLTISYLRYIPDPDGERVRDGRRYSRLYDLDHTRSILRCNYPHYLNRIEKMDLIIQSIPENYVFKKYDPREKLREFIKKPEGELQITIVKLVESLQFRGVPIEAFGVSGSVLINLAGPDSDVDLIVYGKENSRKAYEVLNHLRNETDWIASYNDETVMEVVRSRWEIQV